MPGIIEKNLKEEGNTLDFEGKVDQRLKEREDRQIYRPSSIYYSREARVRLAQHRRRTFWRVD